ncbi:zinc finger, PHD-type, conserved site containing protein [Tanacetum coccineum]
MNLVVYKPKPYQTEPCQICREPIQGLVYECKSCNFLVHPLCVSSNSGLNQVRSALPSSGSTTQRRLTTPTTHSHSGSTSQGIGEQVGVGLATNYIYDTVKDEGDGDFFDGIVSVIGSIFSSSSK